MRDNYKLGGKLLEGHCMIKTLVFLVSYVWEYFAIAGYLGGRKV